MDVILAVADVESLSIPISPLPYHLQAKATLEFGKHSMLAKPINIKTSGAKSLYDLAQHCPDY